MTAAGTTVLTHRSPAGDLRRSVRLFRRFMGGRRVYVAGVALLLLEAATAVVEPLPIAFLIDFLQGAAPSLRELGGPVLLPSVQWETILLLTIAVVGIAAVNSAADSLTEVCMARGGRSLGYGIRVAMYGHLQRLPLGYHDKRRTGDVLTRVTGDVLVVEDFIVNSVSNILGSLLVLVGSFAFLASQSWNVALVALVVVPVLAVIANHFSRRIKSASKTQRDREGDLASTAQEMLTSIRLVQSYGRGKVDLDRFAEQTAQSMKASVSAANIQAQFSFVIALVEALAISAVVWLGVWLVEGRAISIGTLILFVLLLQNMFKPARKIVSEWYKIGKVFASVERIEDLLNRDVGVQDAWNARRAPDLTGQLTFYHVGFSYPGEHEEGIGAPRGPKVLDDIHFDVAAGEVVALVGYSGAGKSTIAQLVPRLYDPDVGDILVDGIPVRRLTLASLRAQVSLVLQETILLSGTVAENIAYGVEFASREQIEAAARMANAHDFISALPDGYETLLGERGATLSGGQRQRIAIARAFIRRAPVLILDEPTTGLDAESAQTVVDALRTLMRGTTTLVISHDPGLIRGADRILVIAAGRIVEAGTHESLVRAGGEYARLYANELDPQAPVGLEHPTRELLDGRRPGASTVQAGPRLAAGDESLQSALARRLPGFEPALDPVSMTARINDLLVKPNVTVTGAAVGKLWLRDDGSCQVRYRVSLAGSVGDRAERVVVGRLFRDDQAAQAYTRHGILRLPDVRGSVARVGPWRSSAAVLEGTGLAIHPFPLDPALPTLPRALDRARIEHVLGHEGDWRPAGALVVHHPRTGPCVVRYRLSRGDHRRGQRRDLYAKVYGDGSGDIVEGFLRALDSVRSRFELRHPVRFPRAILYDPELRLLLTESLPGAPRVPDLVKRAAAGEADGVLLELRSAVAASARALAGLHQSDLATAPVRSASDEVADLRRELDVVDLVWPDVAQSIRRRVERLFDGALESPDMVLSHGDFTPSQVLLGAGPPGIVDLDTLCWADPALDLGRFLAHLHLLAARHGGPDADRLVEDLTGSFLAAYREAAGGSVDQPDVFERVAFYKGTTLARSALHACRQLKHRRLEVAISLLDALDARKVDR